MGFLVLGIMLAVMVGTVLTVILGSAANSLRSGCIVAVVGGLCGLAIGGN